MNIQPLHDYYLIKLIEPEEKITNAGLVLPETLQKNMPTVMGVVMQDPAGRRYTQDPINNPPLKGKTVIIKPDVTIMYEAVDMGDDGKFFLVKDEHIIAFLKEEEDEG